MRRLILIAAATLVASFLFVSVGPPIEAQTSNCPIVSPDELARAVAIPAGGCRTFGVRDYTYLTVIVADGGTATISRVDTPTATDHTETQSFVAAVGSEDFDIFIVDWPFYRVSLADEAGRVGAAPRTVK